MSRNYFIVEKGMAVADENGAVVVKYLNGTGAPSLDAEVGSEYKNITTGEMYQKKTAGSGADKWVKLATADDLLSISFRSEKVIAATGDVGPSSGSVLDLVATPFGDDESPKLIAADFDTDSYIMFGVGGTPKLMKVSLVAGDSITVIDAPIALVAHDKFVVQNYLPDSPAGQEVQALIEYTGSAVIKLGDINWNFADGIGLASGYAAVNGSVSNTDTVNSAIEKLDGNQIDLITLSGVAQGATNLGSFTGSTLNSTETNKSALQKLVTAVELAGNDVVESSALAVTTATVIDEMLVDSFGAVKWLISIRLDSAPAQKKCMEVFACHNGTASADATVIDDTVYAKLKIGAEFNAEVAIVLSGTGTTQKMQLKVTASSAVSVKATRLNVAF
jgi:hypothetical protein